VTFQSPGEWEFTVQNLFNTNPNSKECKDIQIPFCGNKENGYGGTKI